MKLEFEPVDSLIRLEQSDWMLRRNMYVITCQESMQNYELAKFNKFTLTTGAKRWTEVNIKTRRALQIF